MASYISEFRDLRDEILDFESRQIAPRLFDWAREHAAIMEPLRQLQQFNAPDNSYEAENDDLESLYALSRVCETLTLPFQGGEDWFDLSRNQFAEFWQTLGVLAREPRKYHPFWCEIVLCENGADDAAPPRVEEIFWPALTWGELLICRAGVRVAAGRNWINAEVASSSPLYFASRRNYRAAHDLSHGWGGNSQWRTDFRRDYVWGEHYVFNADGARNYQTGPFLQNFSGHEWAELLAGDRQLFASDKVANSELTLAEREELLVNRCLVREAKADMDNFWPYDDVAVWRRDVPLSPAKSANLSAS